MPDLQTELSKIAHAWDNHEQQIRNPQAQQEKAMPYTAPFAKTGNATKDTFEVVRLHPLTYTPMQLTSVMTQHGYKRQSVGSLIVQMKRVGLIKAGERGFLYTDRSEFISLHQLGKKFKAKAVKQVKQVKHAKPKKAGLTALVPDTASTITLPSTLGQAPAHVWTAENVLMNINVAEAAKLYAELGKLFGGK